MAVYLITGKPGSYKSAFAMEQALKYIKDGRLVYFCNFRGLQAEKYGLNVLEHPNQWVEQEYQQGAVFFIDEIQEFTREVPTNAKTEDLPKWFTLLEKHRHLGYDFYVVTQHPMFIHTHIRRLLEKHYHMQRAEGLPFANKREWQQVCNEPENIDNATIKRGCTVTIYRPDKKVFDYYESTKLDTHKLKVPRKLITYAILVLLGILISVWLGSGFFKKYVLSDKTETTSQTTSNNTQNGENKPISPYDAVAVLDDEKIQLKTQIVELQGQINEMKEQQQQSQIIDYDPNQPLQHIDYQYQAKTQPYLSGCIEFDRKCECYTQQGSKLQVSYKDCKHIIKHGLPFNPFHENIKQNHRYSNIATAEKTSVTTQQTSSTLINAGDNKNYFDTEPANFVGVKVVN